MSFEELGRRAARELEERIAAEFLARKITPAVDRAKTMSISLEEASAVSPSVTPEAIGHELELLLANGTKLMFVPSRRPEHLLAEDLGLGFPWTAETLSEHQFCEGCGHLGAAGEQSEACPACARALPTPDDNGGRGYAIAAVHLARARWTEDRFAEVARKVGCRVEHTEGLHVTVDGLEVRFVGPDGVGGRGVVTSSGEDG